jgi:hypothetical protein
VKKKGLQSLWSFQPRDFHAIAHLLCICGETDVTNKEMVGSLVFRGRAKVAFARWRSPMIGRLGADSSVEQFFGKPNLLQE